MKTNFLLRRSALFVVTGFSFVLLSPKWVFPLAAWFAPFLLILLVAPCKPWKSYILSVLALFASTLVSQYKVMPFPGVFFPIMTFVISLQAAIPYIINRLLYPKIRHWVKTLVFPLALVSYEYITSFGGGGSWSSIAYTQVTNSFFIQATSLLGIWIISFAIGWFASLLFYLMEEQWNWSVVRVPTICFVSMMLGITLFGFVKTNSLFEDKRNTVRVAGISSSHVPLLKVIYEDTFGNGIEVHEDDLTQNSPELVELNKGLAAFVEDPYNEKFFRSRLKLTEAQDELFKLSGKEAGAGSQIISWSEAAVFTVKAEEELLFKKGRDFAKDNGVYFLMTVASILPGKIEFGKKFIENKALLFDPEGNMTNVFFKNRPVPLIEPSVPGDGNVPVMATKYGNLATSICYDADFPQLMRQLGRKDADILLLPSGDWKEVSPYHAHMAVVRAIENGTSLLRPVSGAVSIACDYHGNIAGQRSYFDSGERVVVAHLPLKGIKTLYSAIGDSFAWICISGLVCFSGSVIFQYTKRSSPVTSSQL